MHFSCSSTLQLVSGAVFDRLRFSHLLPSIPCLAIFRQKFRKKLKIVLLAFFLSFTFFFGPVAAFARLYSHEPVFDRLARNGRRCRDCLDCGSLIRQSGEIRGLNRPVEEFDGRDAGADDCPATIGREPSGAQRRDLRCSQDHTGGSAISRFAPPRPLRPP